ncbi:hypothetical protein FACS1894142_0610 [Spirochaetia bacterium]|nr:hypothetical protein FACS1894142_0610 [Spirochaetia bacterium]
MDDISFSIYTEKIHDKGEDSDPLLIVEENFGLLGVFDGLGGAGGTQYEEEGVIHTGAYYSSRVTRDSISNFFQEFVFRGFADHFKNNIDKAQKIVYRCFDLFLLDTLKNQICDALRAKINKIEKEPSKIRSSLIKRLPTTAVFMFYQKELSTRELLCFIIWAGDSRGYCLDVNHGLRQITRDDIKTDGDALDNLKDDSPMSNFIHIEEYSFKLNKREDAIKIPTILLVATDGCFGYLDSPMHFEYILLKTMNESNSPDEWKEKIESEIKKITNDDATLALVAIGWPNFDKLKIDFDKRYIILADKYINPIFEIDTEMKSKQNSLSESNDIDNYEENRATLIKGIWDNYKKTYESMIVTGNNK